MNILLWVLQVLAAFLYGASGVMKVFLFDKVSKDVPSFGALPRGAWMALGLLELVCTVGLIVPAAFHWQPALTEIAAAVLAIESLVFIVVHAKYGEITPIVMSGALGLLMAFIAYGRMVLSPISRGTIEARPVARTTLPACARRNLAMPSLWVSVRLRRLAASSLLALALPFAAQDAEPVTRETREARQYELAQLKPLFDKCYEAGSDYYKNGWRSEALWCFERATKLLPEAGNLKRFTSLLRDFDNPAWRKKRWRSPRAGVDAGFKRRQELYDTSYATALLKIAGHHERDDGAAAQARARTSYLDALAIVGGPYEVDAQGQLRLGKAGTIPAEASRRLIDEELVLINGKRWLRDSMLKSLPATAAVHEARSDRVLVRTTTTLDEATRLLDLLEQAYSSYEARFGPRKTARPLGLFVFPDNAAYQEWCKASNHGGFARAAGFANSGEGFAVTFPQPSLDKTAVHEGAHLFHFDVFAAPMPSWYEEGIACFFGHERSMTVKDGKLATGLEPTVFVLAPLIAGGRLQVPLDDLLHGDAAAKIAGNDGSAGNFYLASWALYWFLSSTSDPRLSTRFEEWESFALGSRGGGEEDAAELFDRLFADVRADLESAFAAWLAHPK